MSTLTDLKPGTRVRSLVSNSWLTWDVATDRHTQNSVIIEEGDLGVVIGRCKKPDHAIDCPACVVKFPRGIINLILSTSNFKVIAPPTDPMPLNPRRRLQLA